MVGLVGAPGTRRMRAKGGGIAPQDVQGLMLVLHQMARHQMVVGARQHQPHLLLDRPERAQQRTALGTTV